VAEVAAGGAPDVWQKSLGHAASEGSRVRVLSLHRWVLTLRDGVVPKDLRGDGVFIVRVLQLAWDGCDLLHLAGARGNATVGAVDRLVHDGHQRHDVKDLVEGFKDLLRLLSELLLDFSVEGGGLL